GTMHAAAQGALGGHNATRDSCRPPRAVAERDRVRDARRRDLRPRSRQPCRGRGRARRRARPAARRTRGSVDCRREDRGALFAMLAALDWTGSLRLLVPLVALALTGPSTR